MPDKHPENGKKVVDLRHPEKLPSEVPQESFLRKKILPAPGGSDWLLSALFVGFTVAIFFLTAPLTGGLVWKLEAGGISPTTIRARKSFLVQDRETTAQRVGEAVNKTREIFDLDPDMIITIDKKLSGLMEQFEEAIKEGDPLTSDEIEALKSSWVETFGSAPANQWFQRMVLRDDRDRILQSVVRVLDGVFSAGVVSERKELIKERHKGIMVRWVNRDRQELVEDVDSFLDVSLAKDKVQKGLRVDPNLRFKTSRALAQELASLLIRPNLTSNRTATEEARQAAENSVKPVYYQITKGEVIIREGEPIDRETLAKLNALREMAGGVEQRLILPGWLLLSILIGYFSWRLFQTNICRAINSPKRLGLMLFLGVGYLLIIQISLVMARAFAISYPSIPPDVYQWGVPLAVFPVMAAVFFDPTSAGVLTILGAVFVGLTLEPAFPLALYYLIAGIVAILSLKSYRSHSHIFRAGGWIAGVNVFYVVVFSMTQGLPFGREMALQVGAAFVGGLSVGLLALAFVPILGATFKETTDIKLLELQNMTQTILRKLVTEAPGTYHHSIMVGNLAEAGAESVGANPLLARVGAYYHDIGKLSKPQYFIENMVDGENIHDRLAPSMSALIIISHVREGIELAKQHRLPEEIISIIRGHHGTNLIGFFYQKAQEEATAKGRETVKEEEFRYPGPKPPEKEAAIVMLADQVEAAARAMREPEPTKIKALIQTVINDAFADGQLSECQLTLHDLNKIAQAFSRVLEGMIHRRVDYPRTELLTASPVGKKGKNGRRNQKPAAAKKT